MISNANPKKYDHGYFNHSGFYRCLASFITQLDCLIFFSGVNTGRFSRAFFPAIYVSRRSSFRNIFSGLVRSLKGATAIIKFLVFTTLIWGFIGFCIFRDSDNLSTVEEGEEFLLGRFDTFGSSLFAVLLCYTSRASTLYVMNPFYKLTQFSALYFVTLTVFADILCINLMVAVGNSEYASYSSKLFISRLQRRL
jgi:hypothetical protein